MRHLSIRSRITIGSVIVAALLLSGAMLIVREQVSSILSNADVALAQGDLTSFEKDIASNPTAEVDNPGTGVLVYVRNPDSSVQVNTLPHDISERVGGSPATRQEFSFADDEGRDFIVVGQTVKTSAGVWALWAARSTSSSELAIEGLDHVLVVGGIVLLLGFGFASWILATVALRPVNRMRRQAAKLGTSLEGELPVGAARDELAALATTLNELLARLRASSIRERQMISDAAHELRTPLAALTTQLELAHDDEGDAAALSGHLQGAESSVARLAALATNLLELNRLDADVRSPGVASGDELTTELMGAIDRARMLGIARSLEIRFDIQGSEDLRVALDARSFGRILDNLLVNAVNAVDVGGSIDVGMTITAPDVVVTITDDGHGMPDDFLDKAFERFSRPDDARSAASGGSGLGLALVRGLVESAGGTVRVRNRTPGLEVEVRLPQM